MHSPKDWLLIFHFSRSSERDNRLIMEIISRIPRFRSESVSVKELTASSMSFKAIEKAGEIGK